MSLDAVGASSQFRSTQAYGGVKGPVQQPQRVPQKRPGESGAGESGPGEVGESAGTERLEAAARSNGPQQGSQAAPAKPSAQSPGGHVTPLRGQNLNIVV